ncbi:hypothetical protein D9757_005908 [Collybiopsis confluens]|uniref:Aminopeptidase n=1 Tax=Collybiopsis confluens TaxID=2823264 RepID=A0A8H5MA27_9AGAR|nr:hypothetical protein D9757_005908 [Collybiopsis confluens]
MDYRLPTNVSPSHYTLAILTDLAQHKFRGTVEIDLKVNEDTSTIVLNSANLQLADASVTITQAGPGEAFVPVSQSVDAISERATFVFPSTFKAGSALQLFIAFEGELSGNLVGYYEGTWEHEGEKKYYTVTQFEPTAARRAFPCWDEPLCKATFVMSMISRSGTVNLFNTPVVSEEPYEEQGDIHGVMKDVSPGDWTITRFDTSPLMSTYLVAFANGEFEYIESSFKSPISGKTRPLRVYASSSLIHQARYCLEVTAKVLPVYEQVFDIEYPLPKLDTLVIQDFDAYAMENWGLIVGRASQYLLDPNASNLAQKQAVVANQFHEIAHMWFGNITTMEWWTYLYLNEGFATLMGELIIPVRSSISRGFYTHTYSTFTRVFQEWKLDSAFIHLHINDAMRLDNKLSSHPVEVDCPDANKINQIFDALSYSKAASVLRMLANHVGVDAFLKGVSAYLKAHLYGNSVTEDLWKGITEATGFDASEFMNAYISKPGIPLISVSESETEIQVTQTRFLQKGAVDDANLRWQVLPDLNVPLNISTIDAEGKQHVNKTVLKSQSESYPIDIKNPFKLNAGSFGYYRVLYSPERFRQIAVEAAKPNSGFDVGDRLGLVQDAFALASAQLLSPSIALDLLLAFKDLREYYVWATISAELESLLGIWWENQSVVELLNDLRRTLFKPIVNELGYEYSADEDPDISLLRSCAIANASRAKDDDVVNELRKRFKHFQDTKDTSGIPQELQGPIYAAAVRYGGEEEYQTVKQLVKSPNTPPPEQVAAISAMCSTQDPKLILSTIDYMANESRDQDIHAFILELMKNTKARNSYLEYFKGNYDKIYQKFKDGFAIGGIVKLSFSPLTTKKDYEETKDFLKDGRDTSKYSFIVPQILESIQEKIVYIDTSTGDMREWLRKWKKGQ